MAKSIRFRIGKKHSLPKLGLTSREFAAHKIWESKSEAEKIKIRDNARERLAKYRGKP